jgi:hypothetical protein
MKPVMWCRGRDSNPYSPHSARPFCIREARTDAHQMAHLRTPVGVSVGVKLRVASSPVPVNRGPSLASASTAIADAVVTDATARYKREEAHQRWREEASRAVMRRPERLAWMPEPSRPGISSGVVAGA